MKVQEIMSGDVTCADCEMSVCEAASLMKMNNVGWLPVLSGGKIVGVLTDRDITCRCTAEEFDPEDTTCEDVMTRNCFSCHLDDTIHQAAEFMEQKKIRRLAVLDSQNKLCGVISMTDLVTKVHDRQLAGEVMEQVCMAPASM